MGVYNESQLEEGRGATCGQYHKFAYVLHRGINSHLMTKLIALLSPTPTPPPRHRHHGVRGGQYGKRNKRDGHPRRIDRRRITQQSPLMQRKWSKRPPAPPITSHTSRVLNDNCCYVNRNTGISVLARPLSTTPKTHSYVEIRRNSVIAPMSSHPHHRIRFCPILWAPVWVDLRYPLMRMAPIGPV